MKRTLVAFVAVASLALPVTAQQQDPNQNPNQTQDSGQKAGPSDQQQGAQSRPMSLSRGQARMLQQALNRSGLNAGPADGVIGARTKEALQKFQSQKRTQCNGRVGPSNDRRSKVIKGAGKRHRPNQQANGVPKRLQAADAIAAPAGQPILDIMMWGGFTLSAGRLLSLMGEQDVI